MVVKSKAAAEAAEAAEAAAPAAASVLISFLFSLFHFDLVLIKYAN